MKTLFRNALFALLLIPGQALAQGCVEYSGDGQLILRDGTYFGPVQRVVSYFALITDRDLYNSAGVRLHDFRAILQQDRANLHKTGIADSYVKFDETGNPVVMAEMAEDYFTTAERRMLLSTARYFQYCYTKGQTEMLENEIARGQVNAAMLRVTVFVHPSGELSVLIAAVG